MSVLKRSRGSESIARFVSTHALSWALLRESYFADEASDASVTCSADCLSGTQTVGAIPFMRWRSPIDSPETRLAPLHSGCGVRHGGCSQYRRASLSRARIMPCRRRSATTAETEVMIAILHDAVSSWARRARCDRRAAALRSRTTRDSPRPNRHGSCKRRGDVPPIFARRAANSAGRHATATRLARG